MSEDKPHGATTIHPRKDHDDGSGGGAGKWILGAIAAAVLVGGGYYAWTNYAPSQSSNPELAQNDDPYAYEPLPSDASEQSVSADEVTIDEPAAEPAAADTPRAAPARRSVARAEPVPEATIGVTPASATSDESATSAEFASVDSDELVITARRPIWASTPSPRRLSAMYPQRALDRGREGEARLACIVQERGRLTCDQIEATPGGFGAAAERVAGAYRHTTTLANGESAVGTPVNLRVIFRIDENDRGRRFASR